MSDPAANDPAVFSCRSISLSYGSRLALDQVTFAAHPGHITALLGANGSGKSSLLAIAAGVRMPTSGVVDRSPERSSIGVVFQTASVDPLLSVRENLALFATIHGLDRSAVDESAARFELTDRLDQRAATLSGGLLRRLDLARAVIHTPTLLLLDEPATGLDAASRASFFKHVAALRDAGTAVVLATHDTTELHLADRLHLLDEGQTAFAGDARLGDRESDGVWVELGGQSAPALGEELGLSVSADLASGFIERRRLERALGKAATLGLRIKTGDAPLDAFIAHVKKGAAS